MTEGEIKVEVMARSALKDMSRSELIEYVIRRAKDGAVIVFEGQLNPDLLTEIIRRTMEEVDLEEFTGIDIYVVPPKRATRRSGKGLMKRLLGRRYEEGMTVISPANVLKDLEKGEDFITLKLG
ncbi:MAG: DUF2073 domain-containing protein [Euryarchaeota archaeon]